MFRMFTAFSGLLATLLLSNLVLGKDLSKVDFDRTRVSVEITVIVYETQKLLDLAWAEYNEGQRTDRGGFAVWTATAPYKCSIHVLKIYTARDRKNLPIWGHELAHCVYGSFHD